MIINRTIDGEEKPLYMDGGLYEQLTTKVMPSVQKKDWDWFVVIDGMEGAGKSVLGFQIAKVLDPDFTHEQIAYNANEFIALVIKAKKHQCIVFDEAFTGLSSRTSLSEINNLLVSLMMEMRQKNLFIILIMPSFFMLDKYCVLHRAKGLFNVYMRNGKRGFWNFYNKNRMKYLYLKGKKFYEYNSTKPIIFGRFQDQYMINKGEYLKIKKKALHRKRRKTKGELYKAQRDILFYVLTQRYNKTQLEIAKLCTEEGYKIDNTAISLIVREKIRNRIIDRALETEENDTKEDDNKNETLKGNAPPKLVFG